MKKIALLLFCILFLCICTLFSVGLLFTGNQTDKSDFPVLLEDGKISDNFSNAFEQWFSKNFAFSSTISDFYAQLKYTVFREGNDQVVAGKDGFYFFQDTINDYIGLSSMTDAEIEETARALLSFQENTLAEGADFLFVCAPNKNSIYGSKMPDRYIPSTEASNMERLFQSLDALGVQYVDLRPILAENAETQLVYHKRDTHWNGLGALLAVESMLSCFDMKLPDLTERGPLYTDDFPGDLSALLYQNKTQYDMDITYDFSGLYVFTSAYSTPMDMIITARGGGEKKLLMFRDSFANACIPYLASAFAETHFERAVPYRSEFLKSYMPDVVIIEIAERNLPALRTQIIPEA